MLGMINSFGSTRITVSDLALERWTEKRVRFVDFVWKGKRDWRTVIVEVECTKPAAFRLGDRMVVHPQIYKKLMAAAPPVRQFTEGVGGERMDITPIGGGWF